jgi:hypothetical protein
VHFTVGCFENEDYENEDLRWVFGLRNYENEDPSLFSYYENPKIFIYIVFAKISVKVSRNGRLNFNMFSGGCCLSLGHFL